MLVVYVDDFLLVGEKKSVDIGWTKIRTVVKLGDTGPLGHFLGCTHDVSKSTNADGSVNYRVLQYARLFGTGNQRFPHSR
jgi:hypothetical protein